MTTKEKLLKLMKLADAMYYAAQYLTTDASRLHKAMDEYHKFIIHECKEEPVSEELEEASRNYADDEEYGDDVYFAIKAAFKAGAKWYKEHSWKSADGDDLPEIDREVVVLIKYNTQRNINDEEYPTYRVGFGHRPNPDGWDGRNIDTNEVTHYTPKLYDKGGWNIPNVKWWLDCQIPNMGED